MLEKKVVELADQLEAALKTAAPEVANAVGTAIFVKGFMVLLVSLVASIGLAILGKHLWKLGENYEPGSDERFTARGAGLVAWAVATITMLSTWGSAANWLAVFNQKAWLALKLIDKVGGG